MKVKTRIEDPAMDIAREVASEFGYTKIPPSLGDPTTVAIYLDAIDDVVSQVAGYYQYSEELKRRFLDQISQLSREFITDVESTKERISLTLRLWAGCLDAAKTIAIETRNGPNIPDERNALFSRKIDPLAKEDNIYCAGVAAAIAFKILRNQEYSTEGVPKNSVVRNESETV